MTYWILGITALLLLAPACTSALSTMQHPRSGVVNDRLQPCPSSPNCVCSEFPDHASYITPVDYNIPPEDAWIHAVSTMQEMGGTLITQGNGYLHATFTSSIFRFVDDFELRMDNENRVIHLRSASRTGYFDFGVNRTRAERFRNSFTKKAALP